jgi:predicted acylesterase/phospholipase RssA
MVDRGQAYALTRNYRGDKRECDLVMKGGVTSGVIYPGAICKLAEKYRFRSIGGASAGAIAAATAAAAEYARQTGNHDHGFDKLAELPDQLGRTLASGRTRLASLFQPVASTEPAFDVAFAALSLSAARTRTPRISKRQQLAKGLSILFLVIRAEPAFALLGVVLAIGAFVLGLDGGALGLAVAIPCAIVVFVAGLAGSAIVAARDAYRAVTNNLGGLCRGYGTDRDGDPPLTTWLTDQIHDIAGVKTPLTFGQLEDQKIELVMMTTNLTHGRPHRVPFRNEILFFKRSELEQLFPPAIVEALVIGGALALKDCARDNTKPEPGTKICREEAEHEAKDRRKRLATLREIARRNPEYVPLPDRRDLPVAFAVRLSLSFPVLLSAVPLHTVDFSLPTEEQTLRRCWFSDGGICSNLPIHFFDSLLPTRPTFALDLRQRHFEISDDVPETEHVELPVSNNEGHAEQWRPHSVDGLPIAELIVSMVETMKSWNDNMQSRGPGYRDRIAHIRHLSEEGGLNLDMPATMITRLSQRGAAAGHKLAERFFTGDGWDNHLWIRYCTTLGMLQPLLGNAHRDYFKTDTRGRAEIDRLLAQHTTYRMSDPEREAAAAINKIFARLHELPDFNFEASAPRPSIELRARLRDS